MFRYFRRKFTDGLIVLLPIGVTVWVLINMFRWIDNILKGFIEEQFGISIVGLGFFLTVLIVLVVGIVSSNYLGTRITRFFQNVLLKIPIIKTIYGPLREVFGNFSKSTSKNFKKAVFVKYPIEGSYSVGFITKENVEIDGKDLTAVFIPTTPNPTSGFLVYLEKDMYVELDMPVENALKSIISLGSIMPDEIKITE